MASFVGASVSILDVTGAGAGAGDDFADSGTTAERPSL